MLDEQWFFSPESTRLPSWRVAGWMYAMSDECLTKLCDMCGIKVDDIANAQWKEASERYELQKGVEWHCVEGAYRKFTLVRCIADNPNVGTVREEYFLKP